MKIYWRDPSIAVTSGLTWAEATTQDPDDQYHPADLWQGYGSASITEPADIAALVDLLRIEYVHDGAYMWTGDIALELSDDVGRSLVVVQLHPDGWLRSDDWSGEVRLLDVSGLFEWFEAQGVSTTINRIAREDSA